jgi:hypothetical protein
VGGHHQIHEGQQAWLEWRGREGWGLFLSWSQAIHLLLPSDLGTPGAQASAQPLRPWFSVLYTQPELYHTFLLVHLRRQMETSQFPQFHVPILTNLPRLHLHVHALLVLFLWRILTNILPLVPIMKFSSHGKFWNIVSVFDFMQQLILWESDS